MIYIRADANSTIAIGHVMRCLSIANGIRRAGGDCTFITADSYPLPIIADNHFAAINLESKWNDLEIELEQMTTLIRDRQIKVLLIDSYYVTSHYLSDLKKCTKVVYLDDINQFIYPVDMIINYSVYADNFNYTDTYINRNVQFLLGCKYTPLRKEFLCRARNVKETVSNLLLTTGGSDPFHISYLLLKELLSIKKQDTTQFHVIVGSFNQQLPLLKELQGSYPQIHLYQNAGNIAEIMLSCDIAVSAGGTTMMELCACGLPTICFAFADNQLDGVEEMQKKQIMIGVGDIRSNLSLGMNRIIDGIHTLESSFELRKMYSLKMQALVDGKGADRIADYLKRMADN